MTTVDNAAASDTPPKFVIKEVRMGDTWIWLQKGWADYRAARMVSISYGLFFVVAGLFLTFGLVLTGLTYLISPMIGGFLLIGPILGIGLCEISRDLEQGKTPTLWRAVTAFRRNVFHIMTAGLVLMIFMMIWVRIAVLIYVITFPYAVFSWENMITHALTSIDGFLLAVVGTAVGFGFATVAFVFGVVSLPLMLDRKEDIFRAASVSFRAVLANRRTMAGWAAIIVLFIGAGFATGFLGLAVSLPLIGHFVLTDRRIVALTGV
ncbi:MAG: DUF2189 domain-containing protein, partial [Rhodospirillaceae bacterium]